MATVGTTTEPTTGQSTYGLNTTNHYAVLVTMPAGGPWEITRLGAWLAGVGSSAAYRLCVWSAGGSLLGQTSQLSVAGQSFGLGHNTKAEADLVNPVTVSGGAQVYVGFARAPSDDIQFGTRSGSRVQWYNSSWPVSFGSWSSASGAIGAYVADYQSANNPPNAPVSLNPTGSEIVHTGTAVTVSGTRSDPDSGDYISRYNVAYYKDDGTFLGGNDPIDPSGSPTTFSRTISLPAAHAYYKWKARTYDKAGVAGPYTALQRFYANGVPATPGAPAVETDTLTPRIDGSFSDPGDTLAAVQIEVSLSASPNTSKWASGDLAKSGTSWNATYAGSALSYGIAYRARYRVKDSHGAYSSWSAYKTFTLVQPVGPDNNTPRTTNPRLSSLTPTLTVGHLAAQFRNEEIMVRTVASDAGGITLWSKTFDGVDYANTNSKARVYAGTALAFGGIYYWKSRIELTDGTISAWSPYHAIRINADPTAPTAMVPTGGVVTADTTPQLRMRFADPDTDQGDAANLATIEVRRNDNDALVYSQTAVAKVSGTGEDGQQYDHLATVGPLNSMTTITGANATDIITRVAHNMVSGQKVRFSALTGGTGLSTGVDYFVRDVTTDTFKLAATLGGVAINFTTDITAATLVPQELGLDLTYKWRGQFSDTMGRTGPFSAYQIFKVSTAPTAAGVSPTGVLSDSTPLIDWTFAGSGGKTQYSFQVKVFDKGPTGAPSYQQAVLARAPLVYYRLGEAASPFANLGSGAPGAATPQNGPVLESPGLLVRDEDAAVLLDGVNDWIQALTVPAIGPGLTMAAWVSSADDKIEYIMSRGSNAYLRRSSSTNDQVTMSWFDAGSVQRTLISSVGALPADGLPHLVIGTHDGTTARLYVDGVEVGSSVFSLLAVTTGTWGIGSNNVGSADWWHGTIDEVALWALALSPADVLALYQAGTNPQNYPNEVEVHDSGEQVTSATQYALPHGVLADDHDYRWQVTVKDTDMLAFTLA